MALKISTKEADLLKHETLEENHIPSKEFWMFAVAGLGQGMIYSVMSSYVSDFYTNVMKLPLLFVLLLMLLARVWDAINDPLMGMIVDRHTTKWGKMKPYIVFMAVPIALFTFLMFYCPELNKTGLMIYAGFVYVFWGMIYTAADVPFWSLPNIMTPNPNERGRLISIGRTLNGIGSAIPMVLYLVAGFVLPAACATMSKSDNGVVLKFLHKFTDIDASGALNYDKMKYMLIAVFASVIGIILFVNSYHHIKERVNIPNKKRQPGEQSQLARIFSCKPLMLVVLMGILSSGRYMLQAASVHVARYAIYIGGDLSAMDAAEKSKAISSSISTVSTIFSVCSAVGMFGAMLFMPYLMKRFNYKKIVITTSLFGFAASIITSAVGYFVVTGKLSFFVCIPFLIISAIPLGVLNVASYAMVADSLDYMEWQTGFRDTGLGSACQGFVNKLGNALATAGIIAMYMAINLDPSTMLEKTAVVAATDLSISMRYSMFSLISIVPGISLLLSIIPLKFYDLVGEKKERITIELAEKRKERGVTVD
jgi:sugar (glycoside-pentoside-hexuronide) transporter